MLSSPPQQAQRRCCSWGCLRALTEPPEPILHVQHLSPFPQLLCKPLQLLTGIYGQNQPSSTQSSLRLLGFILLLIFCSHSNSRASRQCKHSLFQDLPSTRAPQMPRPQRHKVLRWTETDRNEDVNTASSTRRSAPLTRATRSVLTAMSFQRNIAKIKNKY